MDTTNETTSVVVKPVRVQRKRTKGFRLVSPNGLPIVCVTRPGILGNPFVPIDRSNPEHVAKAVDYYRQYITGKQSSFACGPSTGVAMAFIPPWHHPKDVRDLLPKLRGMNLACFCGPDKPCHADVLLELANN